MHDTDKAPAGQCSLLHSMLGLWLFAAVTEHQQLQAAVDSAAAAGGLLHSVCSQKPVLLLIGVLLVFDPAVNKPTA